MGGCPCCEASVAEWLERAVAVRRSQDRIPAGADIKKNLCRRRDLLTTSFSAGLSKYSGSIHSIHTIQSQEQHSLQTPYALELDLGPFPPDIARSFSPIVSSVVCLRERFPPTTYTRPPL